MISATRSPPACSEVAFEVRLPRCTRVDVMIPPAALTRTPLRCRFHLEDHRRLLRVAGRLFSSSMSRPTWSRSTLKVCLPAVTRLSTERGRGEPVAATFVPLLAIERCSDALPPLPRSQVADPRVSKARKSSRTFWKQQIHDYMKAAGIVGGTAG